MGRIRILPDQVANQIAAGEVVDRPASVVKELLENALDAGAARIRVEVEGGGRKLIRVSDDGHGMNRDDALLAFERHATSKLRTADDLLAIATLGFRGEALPSIASVARVTLETATGEEAAGTHIEIAGGKILRVEDAALPRGTTIAVSDLFFNTPARRKFLRAESTELAHVTALVTHYALAHPEKHFEFVSASHTVVSASPVARTARAHLSDLRQGNARPTAAVGSRSTPSACRFAGTSSVEKKSGGPSTSARNSAAQRLLLQARVAKTESQLHLHLCEQAPHPRPASAARDHGGLSQRDSAHQLSGGAFVPGDAARRGRCERASRQDRGALSPTERDSRLCPRQFAHSSDQGPARGRFPRRARLSAFGQPVAHASRNLTAPRPARRFGRSTSARLRSRGFCRRSRQRRYLSTDSARSVSGSGRLPFTGQGATGGQGLNAGSFDPEAWGEAAKALFPGAAPGSQECSPNHNGAAAYTENPVAAAAWVEAEQAAGTLNRLGSLKPLGQLRESFILAAGDDGLWIIDQHVAHERVLFEKILRDRRVEQVQRQRLLMPMLVELKPEQMVVFAQIAEELENNGFEVEPHGPQTLAVKAAPVGLEGAELERTLGEVIDQSAADSDEPNQNEPLSKLRSRIAASIACHSAIKVNTALDQKRIEWLLLELAKTDHPTSCPHGRPIALLYSWKEILRAFHRL